MSDPSDLRFMISVPPKNMVRPKGPNDSPRIAIVVDFPRSADDTKAGVALTGAAEKLLSAALRSAGISIYDCYLTSVFFERPMGNSLEAWLCTKTEAKPLGGNKMPPIEGTKYLHPSREWNAFRLRNELAKVQPNLILVLGNAGMWALTGERTITRQRGTVMQVQAGPHKIKMLPTYHPATVLKQWENYPLFAADVRKACAESETPDYNPPQRFIWVEPDLNDLDTYWRDHIESSSAPIAVDIETKARQITCIGFATSKRDAIVIPFWNQYAAPGESPHYWKTPEEEVRALRWCRKVLRHHRPKVFQNGIYDITYLWVCWGVKIANPAHDTMLLHHSLQPELPKGLGFLGSVYTREPAWKFMREGTKMDTEKREE